MIAADANAASAAIPNAIGGAIFVEYAESKTDAVKAPLTCPASRAVPCTPPANASRSTGAERNSVRLLGVWHRPNPIPDSMIPRMCTGMPHAGGAAASIAKPNASTRVHARRAETDERAPEDGERSASSSARRVAKQSPSPESLASHQRGEQGRSRSRNSKNIDLSFNIGQALCGGSGLIRFLIGLLAGSQCGLIGSQPRIAARACRTSNATGLASQGSRRPKQMNGACLRLSLASAAIGADVRRRIQT